VPEQVRDFSPNAGHCRLEPELEVILVVTDEHGREPRRIYCNAWYAFKTRTLRNESYLS
jgi:hypothetical protein